MVNYMYTPVLLSELERMTVRTMDGGIISQTGILIDGQTYTSSYSVHMDLACHCVCAVNNALSLIMEQLW